MHFEKFNVQIYNWQVVERSFINDINTETRGIDYLFFWILEIRRKEREEKRARKCFLEFVCSNVGTTPLHFRAEVDTLSIRFTCRVCVYISILVCTICKVRLQIPHNGYMTYLCFFGLSPVRISREHGFSKHDEERGTFQWKLKTIVCIGWSKVFERVAFKSLLRFSWLKCPFDIRL